MSAEVIPLPMNGPNALRRIRELAADSANVVRGPEIKGRMRKRRISWKEIILALQKGVIVEGPTLDMKGCWRCTVERFGAGRNLNVVVSICGDDLVVITAFI